ncbi:hypothetical protein Avbf_04696 [Armadillidium vulgare]|nr:hypothetical protein Avbf_04696 [Armadillidium vulgare]
MPDILTDTPRNKGNCPPPIQTFCPRGVQVRKDEYLPPKIGRRISQSFFFPTNSFSRGREGRGSSNLFNIF